MQINKSQTNWEKKKIKRPDKAKHAKNGNKVKRFEFSGEWQVVYKTGI